MVFDVDSNKTFYIETYGCQMNEYDSLIAEKILNRNDSVKVDDPNLANLILLNTCAIRENAHEKVFNRLRSLEHLHKAGAQVGVLGCMVQNLREDVLYQNLPIDFILGPDELRKLTQIKNQGESAEPAAHLKLSRTELYDDIIPTVEHHLNNSNNSITAFVTIQRGCNNFCSFCVVPYTRGRERSRSPESVVEEIKQLVEGGIKSVVLLGQNVNSYKHQTADFATLIEQILLKTKVPRVYFTSPHPKDFPDRLINLMANEERFGSQVHMPLQAGSNEVLKRMKRNYTKETFLELVDAFRSKVPHVAITTDVIVGFPGETEEQVEETRAVMKQANFDSAFMFAYSARKGTLASKLYEDNIEETEKKRRLTMIIEEQMKRSLDINNTYKNKTFAVLVEKKSRKDKNQVVGRIRNGKKVVFTPQFSENIEQYFGTEVKVTINQATSTTLIGSVAE